MPTSSKTWRRTGGPAVYVDFLAAVNPRRFAEIYASALTLEPTQTVESMQEAMQQLVPSFMPRVTITGSGRPGLQLDLWDRERDLRAVMQRIMDTPNQLAAEADKPLALVYDGFEDLLANAEQSLLDEFAKSIRQHRNVAHFFTLRKEVTAQAVFGGERTPFYRLAEPVMLDPVPAAPWIEGLMPHFAEAGAADRGAAAGEGDRCRQGNPLGGTDPLPRPGFGDPRARARPPTPNSSRAR